MTSQDFQTAAVSWVGALAIVVPIAIAAIVKVLPSIVTLGTQIAEIKDRLDRHEARQNQQDKTVAQIALATPSPAASASSQTGN